MKIPLPILGTVDIEFIFLIVLLGLAAYRSTLLIVEDEVLRPLRELIWRRFPPEKSLIGYFFTCVHCVSFWFGIVWLIVFLIWPLETMVVAVVMAISAIVVIIDTALKR